MINPEFLFADYNLPFAVAIFLMLFIGALEVVGALLGGINDWIDGMIPDGLVHFDVNADFSLDSVQDFFGWMFVGKVPVLVLFILLLAFFGVFGYMIQSFVGPLNPWLASGLALLPTIPVTRFSAKGLYKIMPKDETTAISLGTLVGRTGEITGGRGVKGSPAELKVHDVYGQVHYVLVEPKDETEFHQKEKVLLTGQIGNGPSFKGVKAEPLN